MCRKKYNELTETITTATADESDRCTEHHNKFKKFFVEQHMIPIIMEQFLIDLDARSSTKSIVKHSSSATAAAASDDDVNAIHSIDLNEIELFWNDYSHTIPNDLELIWDTIANGLVRYLQVCQ